MASNNQLLGFSSNNPAEVPEQKEINLLTPAWRYHESCPRGKVIKSDKLLKELDAAGWKDHPGKIKQLAGHENVWENSQDEWSIIDQPGEED